MMISDNNCISQTYMIIEHHLIHTVVGETVGLTEGLLLGLNEGDLVGAADGGAVGSAVGPNVGFFEGDYS